MSKPKPPIAPAISAAVSIINPLPATIVALSDKILAEANALAERANATVITDESSYAVANVTYRDMNALAKQVEKERKEIKAPVIALGKQIDEAASLALEPLEGERKALGEKIARFQAEENAKREAVRRQAEERARQEEERLRKAAEEAALMDLPPGEEPPVFEAPVKVAVPVAYTPPALAAAVVTRQVQRVVIDDLEAIPLRGANGVRLWKEPDTKAIEILLKAGVPVPGCKLVTETVVGAKGTR